MPNATVAVAWKEESSEPETLAEQPEQISTWDDAPQASRLLVKAATVELETEIERSKSILDLEAGWDGEGSDAYSSATLCRAIAFLKTHSEWLWQTCGLKTPIPTIGPGPDGSIDLYWKQPTWELLVNIPAETEKLATFYGDNYGLQKIKGTFDPRKFTFSIAAWLMT